MPLAGIRLSLRKRTEHYNGQRHSQMNSRGPPACSAAWAAATAAYPPPPRSHRWVVPCRPHQLHPHRLSPAAHRPWATPPPCITSAVLKLPQRGAPRPSPPACRQPSPSPLPQLHPPPPQAAHQPQGPCRTPQLHSPPPGARGGRGGPPPHPLSALTPPRAAWRRRAASTRPPLSASARSTAAGWRTQWQRGGERGIHQGGLCLERPTTTHQNVVGHTVDPFSS